MAARSIRMAFLALATWAILFAPGAAAEDAGAGIERVDADRVAAAIMAPTFGSDGVVIGRSGRDDDGSGQDRGPVVGDEASAPLTLVDQRPPAMEAAEEPPGDDLEGWQSAPTRAPPVG